MMNRETASPLHIAYHPLDKLYRMSIGNQVARFCGWQPQQLLQVTLWDDLIITVRRPDAVCVICHRPDSKGDGIPLNPGTEDTRMICHECLDALHGRIANLTDRDKAGRP
jgi:hypothetical protein